MSVIGIDLGTSSAKLILMEENGKTLNAVKKYYDIFYPKPGWSEQNPEDWWTAVETGMGELLCGFDIKSVEAIGVAGQMHGLVILDENEDIIRPAILWNDRRTSKQTEYLNEKIGRKVLSDMTANIAFAGFTAPKLLWVKENEPENFKKVNKIMLPKDYINYRLTGVHATDFSDASGMLLLDVKNRCWSEKMLEICSVKKQQMPMLFESYEKIGNVSHKIADLFGFNDDVVVIAGAGDNAGAAIGTATVGEGKCNISIGTSGTIFVSSERFSVDTNNSLHAFCHADGGYHLMGCMLSAASCNKWICDEIFHTNDYNAQEKRIDENKLGRNNVFFLPYLMGERSPINDTNASGLFIGLRPDTKREDLYLSVLEGVAFAIRDNLEVIKKLGIDINKSCLCGGGAKSKLWRRIIANVLNIELDIPLSENGPGYGVAMMAMVGIKKYKSVKECCDNLITLSEKVLPDKALAELYEERYKKFKKIYPTVKELYKEMEE